MSGVAVDVCPRCQGLWFERGALERLLDAGGREALEQAMAPQTRPTSAARAPALLKCSACGTGLQARTAFAYQGDVYCARCRPPSAVPQSG